MLTEEIKTQLESLFTKIVDPIELVASVDDSLKSKELLNLIHDLAQISQKISLRVDRDGTGRKPSFSLAKKGEKPRICFAGVPMGHEFNSLVLAILQLSGYPPKVESEVLEQIKSLEGSFEFETFVSLSCHNCPDVIQALNLMAALNPNIHSTMVDGGVFPEEVKKHEILGVPAIFMNGKPFEQGRMQLKEILARIDKGAAKREAAKINAKEPFDVLVVGAGPAGSTAAIYSARKGLRTGVVCARLGGQVNDTQAIENFISIPKTEGVDVVAGMISHIREYGVDVMDMQQVKKVEQVTTGFELVLENAGVLRTKVLIIATGAKWRELGVSGEKEYRGHGVAYCPHCDGPLFRGKNVAVIGGGNSGVEAAIDLAGVVRHVTLLERSDVLRADKILVDKLQSLSNVTIITEATTTEIEGNGKHVTAILYEENSSKTKQRLELAGVFIQIGLLPNTAWVEDLVQLNCYGEIEISNKGETSVPGIFAAGDCTTVPFKQIVIAMGEGAKASLGAFDYLIRQNVK